METSRQNVLPGRDNVLALLPGKNRTKKLLLEAHMDTVSVDSMSIPPWEPTIQDGKLYGRGSCDTKAGLACMLAALASLRANHQQPHCDVLLAAVVDEEHSCLGVIELCKDLVADAAIVAEPTEMKTIIASKGVLRWEIHANGKSAHSSKTHLGINAIEHMAELLLRLQKKHRSLNEISHPLLGPPTANVGIIRGGVQVNFVPDRCTIQIDRRLIPGEQVSEVLAGYQQMLDEAQRDIPYAAFSMDLPLLIDPSLETSAQAPIARISSSILRRIGYDNRLGGVPFGSDASKIRQKGIDTIIFGPGSIDQAHSAVEYVDIQQVQDACEYYKLLIQEFIP
jgi:acetylornithine deacetylase